MRMSTQFEAAASALLNPTRACNGQLCCVREGLKGWQAHPQKGKSVEKERGLRDGGFESSREYLVELIRPN